MISSRRGSVGIWAGSVLAGTLACNLFSEMLLAQRNTLARNGRWVSTKTTLAKPVIGSVAFLTTRPPLSGNRLDLGAYFGFQEVLHRSPLALRELGFDFRLEEGATLSVLYGWGTRGFSGIRLSRSERLTALDFDADAEGRFVRATPIAIPRQGPGWSHFRIVFTPDGTRALVDERPILVSTRAFPDPQIFGFRGSEARALVDSVLIQTSDGSILVETFRNDRRRWLCLGAALSADLLISLLLARASKRRRVHGGPAAETAALIFLLQLSLACCAAIVWVVDSQYLSRLVPLPRPDHSPPPSRAIATEEEIAEQLRSRPRDPGATRILFLGTSQTWGAGATHPEDVFVQRLEAWLSSEYPGRRFECINAGISGSNSSRVRHLYESEWLRLGAEIAVIDLGNNDTDPEELRRNLEAMLTLARHRGVSTLLVLEANAPGNKPGLEARHRAMHEVASSHQVPLLDLNAALSRQEDTGFLFWDFVHLTSYGHRLAAEALRAPLRALLAERMNRVPTGSKPLSSGPSVQRRDPSRRATTPAH